MRGYFAVLYDDAGPIISGIGSYDTWEGAAYEAMDWADSDTVPMDFSVRQFKESGKKPHPRKSGVNR